MTLSAKITAAITATETGPNDFGGPDFAPEIKAILNLADGTTASRADKFWADQRQIAAASNDDIDLTGVLRDAFGDTINQVELVALMVINGPRTGPQNTTNLTIGGGTNPVVGFLGGTTPTIGPIRPGGVVLLACPDAAGLGAITAGTGDILRIANSAGAAATYQIVVIGRTA